MKLKALSIIFILAGAAKASANLEQIISKNEGTDLYSVIDYSVPHKTHLVRLMPLESLQKRLHVESEYAENSYFKIVDQQDAAQPLSNFDARNVLYHFMKARCYYEKLSPLNSQLNRQVIVRIGVTHDYNPITKASEKLSYNGARYIPKDRRGRWESEVWLHAPKDKYNPMALTWLTGLAADPLSAVLSIVMAVKDFHQEGLDAAKIPGVIYNEAFHYFSDYEDGFKTGAWSHPVHEAYSNYFSASLLGNPKIADLDEYSADWARRVNFSKKPKALFVRDWRKSFLSDDQKRKIYYKNVSQVPSMFWQMRKELGQDIADQVIWSSMKHFKEIKHINILGALMAAAQEHNLTSSQTASIKEIFDRSTDVLQKLDRLFGLSK